MRLVDYLKARLVVVPVHEIGALIASGTVSVDGRPGQMAEPVGESPSILVDAAALARVAVRPQRVSLVIHHEDDDVLVCDKPASMHVHPLGPHREDTLLNALLWHAGARPDQPWGRWRPHPLHRLDRAASGLIAIAKRGDVHDDIRQRQGLARRYQALVHGRLQAEAGTIEEPLGRDPSCDYRRAIVPIEQGGQRAVTHYRRLASEGDKTLVELELETGRTHQIRAHLASIGHPIVGDTLYAPGGERRAAASAILLHAVALRLSRQDTSVECVSPLPNAFYAAASS